MINHFPFKIWNNGKRVTCTYNKFRHIIRLHNQRLIQFQSFIDFCSDIPDNQSIHNDFTGSQLLPQTCQKLRKCSLCTSVDKIAFSPSYP